MVDRVAVALFPVGFDKGLLALAALGGQSASFSLRLVSSSTDLEISPHRVVGGCSRKDNWSLTLQLRPLWYWAIRAISFRSSSAARFWNSVV